MKIAIVEDEREHRQLIKKYIEELCADKNICSQIFEFESGEQFLFENEEIHADALFLDIQMPGISGVDLAKRLRCQKDDIAIVFATGMDGSMEAGSDLEAIHYLKKPIDKNKVSVCLDRIHQRNHENKFILIDQTDGKYKVNIQNIVSVEAAAHNTLVTIRRENVCETMKSTLSFGEMEQLLGDFDEFQKTHRSYIVNLSFVKNITKTGVIMDHGKIIPLSRRLYKDVNAGFIRHFTR